MTTVEGPAAGTGDAAAVTAMTLDQALYEHRSAWAMRLLGEEAVDLDAVDDPAAALASASAAYWVGGFFAEHRPLVVAAAERGVRLVVAVPAETSEHDDLLRAVGKSASLPQSLAAGSVIGSVRSEVAGFADFAAEPAGERPLWRLVCMNVDPTAADARLSMSLAPRLLAHINHLEQALEALRQANVRLARERLGHHDAAAGAIIGKFEARARAAEEQAAHYRERFEFEQQLAIRHHDWFMSARQKLDEPHHRAAERLYPVVRRLPGVQSLMQRMRRK